MELHEKESVDFEHPARGPRHCGQCEHFKRPDACEYVEPPIAREDWCMLFKREDRVLAALRDAGVEPTRDAAIDAMWGDTPPEPWTLEDELQLPESVRDLSWLDKEVEGRAHPGAVGNSENEPDTL